nr:hypothetical protein [Tanacetum cinerariifolium]
MSKWRRLPGIWTFIPETMLNVDIVELESYQRFLLYSTGLIPPKKGRGNGSQGKKTGDTAEENVDVSEESDPKPLVRKKTSTRRVSKKKDTISAADNIVPDPDLTLELDEGTGMIPWVLDESTVIFDSLNEGTGTKPGVHDEEKVLLEHLHVQDQVRKDADEEMKDVDNVESENKEKEEMADATKVDAEKTVSSDYGDQFLDLSHSDNLSGVVKDSFEAESTPLLDVHIQRETPQITPLPAPQVTSTISPMLQTTPIPTPILTPIQTTIPTPPITIVVPEITPLIAVQLIVAKLEQDVSKLKKVDHSVAALASIQSQVPTVVDQYLGTKLDDALHKVLQRHAAELIQTYSGQPALESSKKQESKKSPKEIMKIKREQAESSLFWIMYENMTYNKKVANYKLYHALMEALLVDEEAMDKEVANTVKDHKRKHDGDDDDEDDDEGPSAGPNQGKITIRRRTKMFETAKKSSSSKESSKGKTPTKGSKLKTFPGIKFKELYTPSGDPAGIVYKDLDEQPRLMRANELYKFSDETLQAKTFPGIKFKELYTPSGDPAGIVYKDLDEQPRLMRANELYKFSDETLQAVRDELHHRIPNFSLGFNKEMPLRKWSKVDVRILKLMVELTDKQLLERRIIKNLERLVGAQELEMDYRLMQRTI